MSKIKSPLKKTPPCWEDEKRMTALYSPFRLRDTNPLDYDSKMKFWQESISQWCLEMNSCVFSIKKIQEEFRRNERIPMGLGTVIENLERDGRVRTKEDFEKINPNESWTGWAVKSLVSFPLAWSFHKLKTALLEVDEKTTEYVSLDFLRMKSDELLDKTVRQCSGDELERLYNETELRDLLATPDGTQISLETLHFLLKWMQLNQLALVTKLNDKLLIKITLDKNSCISERELSLYVIQANKLTFEKAIQSLEEEKDQLILSAKSYLKKGMRDTAKSYLRRKKEIEKSIAKRVSALENIEIMLSRIHDTTTDSKVLDTYKIALNALKNSFKESGLSEDEVTQTVSEIEEINEMHEEIQNALAEPISSVGESDLEKELADILAAEKSQERRPQAAKPPPNYGDLPLPNVPSDSPDKVVLPRSSLPTS